MNQENPLFNTWENPPFSQIKEEFYYSSMENAINEAKKGLKNIIENEDTPNFENTILALDRIDWHLNDISSLFFNLLEANSTEKMQQEVEKIVPLISDYENYISHNQALFSKIKTIYDNKENVNYAEDELTLLNKTYDGFVRNGALLSEDDKKRFSSLKQQISEMALQYKNNLLKSTNDYVLYFKKEEKEQLKGIPETNLQIAAQKAIEKGFTSGWCFDLSMPSYSAFMKYAQNREKRKELYLAYNSRALFGKYSNQKLVIDLANARLNLANLLGYKTYADYILCKRMAQDTKTVNDFLQELKNAFSPLAHKEIEQIQEYAKNKDDITDFQPWDWTYYANCFQKEIYHYDEQIIKSFFVLENVQNGIFELVKRLYGLSFSPAKNIEVYHKDVKVFEVLEKNQSLLAILFLDFFPRANKQNGAWMTEFREQRKENNGKRIIPQISLVFNFTPPINNTPSLLTFNEVTTFLHEFGHALHGILSDVKYASLAGTAVERDFVELPSQIMENWAEEKDFLHLFAKNYQSGEIIPDEMISKIKSLNTYLIGYSTLRQLNFAYLDMAFHSIKHEINENVIDFEHKATETTQMFSFIENTAICTSFSHIFGGGYAAGYYGYKWAEVLDADAFEEFLQNGIFSTTIAEKFRKYILSQGGVSDAMTRYVRFKGRKPTINALLKRAGKN